MSSGYASRLLIDVETGTLFIEAGFQQLAVDCYYAVCDVLEFDESLAGDEYEHLRSENEKLGDKISTFIEGSENK